MSHCSEGQMIYKRSSKLLQIALCSKMRYFRPDCVNHRTYSKTPTMVWKCEDNDPFICILETSISYILSKNVKECVINLEEKWLLTIQTRRMMIFCLHHWEIPPQASAREADGKTENYKLLSNVVSVFRVSVVLFVSLIFEHTHTYIHASHTYIHVYIHAFSSWAETEDEYFYTSHSQIEDSPRRQYQ